MCLVMLQIFIDRWFPIKGYAVLNTILFGIAHFSLAPTFFMTDINSEVELIDSDTFRRVIDTLHQIHMKNRHRQIISQWTNALETLSILSRG